jgi:hypothetical protein
VPPFGRGHDDDDDDDDLTPEDVELEARLALARQSAPAAAPVGDGSVPVALAALRQLDSSFSIAEFLIDMQSVISLARQAWLEGKPGKLSGLVDPALWANWEPFWSSWPQQPHFVLRGELPARIRPLDAVVTPASARMRLLVVTLAPQVAGGVAYREVWTMTATRDSTSASVCPTCGAPQGPNTHSACPFCGAALRANGFSWRLADVASGDGVTATQPPDIVGY